MKNRKRILSLMLILTLVISSVPTAFAASNTISDVNNSANEAYEHAANGSTVGITAKYNGNKDQYYRLSDSYFGAFQIDSSTGVVTVRDNRKLNNNASNVMMEVPLSYDLEGDAYIPSSHSNGWGRGHTSHGNGNGYGHDDTNDVYDAEDYDKAVVLTKEELSQKGAMFSTNTVDLNQAFEYEFWLYLGTGYYDRGADGIVFFMNSDEPEMGTHGGSMGYSASVNRSNPAMANSFGVEFDTWKNGGTTNDKNEDHIAFVSGGSSSHASAYNSNPDLENNDYRFIKLTWAPKTNKFLVYMDGKKILEENSDIVSTYLNNKSNAYIGFTGATGAAMNLQKVYGPVFKTARKPSIEVAYGNHTQRFDIDIKSGAAPFTIVNDVATTFEDEDGTIIVNDRNGAVVEFNPDTNEAEQLFDYNNGWFDLTIMNGVMYGVSSGYLYKNIDTNPTQLAYLGSGVNSLEDRNGKLFYMVGKKLKYYNLETDSKSTFANIGYSSAGDLTFYKGKMYLATRDRKLVAIDLEDKTTEEVFTQLPGNYYGSNTYGLSTFAGKIYLGHGQYVSELSLTSKKIVEYHNLGGGSLGISNIFGGTEGEASLKGNILSNDVATSELRVKAVNGNIIGETIPMTQEVLINGTYGTLFIKPNGAYKYQVNNNLQAVQNLNAGETVNEVFNCTVGYVFTDESDKDSTLTIKINGKTDTPSNVVEEGLHLDALDIDGNGSTEETYSGSTVSVWNDSAATNNKATVTSNPPSYNKNAFGNLAGVDFKDTTKSMHIDTHSDINQAVFMEKSFAFVIKTGEDVSGDQVIYEQGGPVRGYNLSIAADPNNGNKPTLWAMIYNNNKNEWASGDFYKPINLGVAEPDTIYTVFMTHDAYEGVFRAYINGDFTSIEDVGSVDGVIQQYAHPNAIGVGGINDQTIHPVTHKVLNEKANNAYKGIIGEIISWNNLLTFDKVTEINNELNAQWKTPEAPTSLNAKQLEDVLEINWPAVSGATEYEVYISKDGVIDGSDKIIRVNTNNTTYKLQSTYANLDEVKIILRYKKDGKISESLVVNQRLLSKPENFIYYRQNENFIFKFDYVEGRAYAFLIDGEVKEVLIGSNEVSRVAVGIDIDTVSVVEIDYSVDGAYYSAGHGLPATPPTLIEVPKVENLNGLFNKGDVELTWDAVNGDVAVDYYTVFVGDTSGSLVAHKTTSKTSINIDDLNIVNATTKYFKVVATMVDGGIYEESQHSNTIAVECIPADFNGVQDGNSFVYTWTEIDTATDYEIYISVDDVITDDDEVYTYKSGETATETIPDDFLALDNVKLLFRYKTATGWSDLIVRDRAVLKAPKRFMYSDTGTMYNVSFTRELGKAYVLKIEGMEDLIITNLDEILIPNSLDIKKAVVYQISYENGVPSEANGMSLGSSLPVQNVTDKVPNLVLNSDKTLISWDAYAGAISYNVYRSDDETTLMSSAPIATGITDTNRFYSVADPDNTYYYTVRAVLEDAPYISGPADPVVVEFSKADYLLKLDELGDKLSLSGFAVGNNVSETGVVPIGNLKVEAQYSQNFKSISAYQISTTGVFDPVIEYVIEDVSFYTISRPAPRVELITIVGGVVEAENIPDFDYKISTVAATETEPGKTKIFIYNFLKDDTEEAPINAIYRVQIASEILAKSQDPTYSDDEKQVVMDAILAKISKTEGREVKAWELIYYSAEAMFDELGEAEEFTFKVKFKWNDSHSDIERPENREKTGAYKETTIKLKNAEKLPTHLNGN